MATPVGGITFGVGIDARDIVRDLQRALQPALRSIQTELNRNPLNVKVNLDLNVSTAQRAIIRQLNSLSDKTVNIKINLDIPATEIARLRELAPALRALRGITDTDIRVRVNLDMSEAELTRLKEIAPALRSLRGLSDRDVNIRIRLDVDEDQLRRVAESVTDLRVALRNFRDRRVRINFDIDRDASERVRELDNGIDGLSRRQTRILALAAGFTLVGIAATSAVGAVGGLALGLAALGPAVGAIIGTVAVATQGVGDAFKAAAAAADSAPTDAASRADAVASAQLQLQSAIDGVTDAQLSLNDAQQDSIDATNKLGAAYQDAERDLKSFELSARGAALGVKEADLALREAQDDLAKAGVDPRKREAALLRVERAELSLAEAQQRNIETQQDFKDAQDKGIENSDKVVAARKRIQDADTRVDQAARSLTKAQQQVTQAQNALTAAQNQGSPAAEKLAAALAKLSPNAREFVLTSRELAPVWEEARKAIQDTSFENLGDELRDLAASALPVFRDGMQSVAQQLNLGAREFSDFLTSVQGLEGLRSTFQGTANLLAGIRTSIGDLAIGMSDWVQAAEPQLFGIGQAIGDIGSNIGRAITEARSSGELSDLFAGFEDVLRGVGPFLNDVIRGLITMGREVLPTLGPLFVALGNVIEQISPALGEIGAVFGNSLTALLPPLGDLIQALAVGLKPVLPVLVGLFKSVLTAVQPLIEPLSRITQSVGQALIGAVDALAPALPPLAEAFVSLVDAVRPLIPLIAEALSTTVQALAPALTEVFRALEPVIRQFADQMRPVMQELAPVLADLARTLGVTLADAIRQIAPILPDLVRAWTDLLLVLVPLLPELVELAVQVLPPLISVLVEVAPAVIFIIDSFTRLAEVTLPLVMAVIDNTREGWQIFTDLISENVRFLTETVFPSIGTALDTVQGWFGSAVEGIARLWAGLGEAAAVPIRFVVNTVWNDGLRKAWNTVAKFLPGVGELEPVTLGFATGGGVSGAGSGTSDDILAWLSNGEHVITASEVLKAGGQNILYAIRDMISRGIPFTWDNGRIITQLGRDNLDNYGARVAQAGLGNVPPEGLFDQLMPKFRVGGAVEDEPWFRQLMEGHKFARAQSGKDYKWAGPQFVGDSFDCSGFMGSIAAAILGANPWQRYWSTQSFAGYPGTGPQGFVKGEGPGFTIGVTNDPGGPGGGHTAGVLGAVGEFIVARVESGGALGNVHYGSGTDPRSFASMYHLPIGANGFFEPGAGGTSVGPSPSQQGGFVTELIRKAFDTTLGPVRGLMSSRIGPPPPEWNRIPPAYLDLFENKSVDYLSSLVGGLGDALSGTWSRAQDVGRDVLGRLNPFDNGGIANGTGFMPKNVIDPERVLSPEQTRLFEALVQSLQSIAGSANGTTGAVTDLLTSSVFEQGVQFLAERLPDINPVEGLTDLSLTRELAARTESSQELVAQKQTDQITSTLDGIANLLTDQALIPIVESAMSEAIGVIRRWLDAGADQVTAGTDRTTRAVEGIDTRGGTGTAAPPFGAPGSAFDAVSAISQAVVSVANTATQAFNQVAQSIAQAALAQTPSRVDQSKGVLGRDISGGPLVDMIVRLTGVEIEIRDTLINTLDQIIGFRGELRSAFDESGRIVADTAELMQRNESSRDLVISEMNRINRELIKAVLKYLVLSVVLPILTAILGAMIQLAVTAIGAAIGSVIPLIGTAIGAAIGAVVGAALAGIAAIFTSVLAVGAGAALDAFDSGGVASGVGFMPKNTIAPERVLSPRQTESFDRLIDLLDRGQAQLGGNVTVNAPFQVLGGESAGRRAHDELLSLLNN